MCRQRLRKQVGFKPIHILFIDFMVVYRYRIVHQHETVRKDKDIGLSTQI